MVPISYIIYILKTTMNQLVLLLSAQADIMIYLLFIILNIPNGSVIPVQFCKLLSFIMLL